MGDKQEGFEDYKRCEQVESRDIPGDPGRRWTKGNI